uniref:Uncharacterized protein n=1 Tax=Strigops habroptila TaxID=2489341 RepID=A0A672V3R0_STRHB
MKELELSHKALLVMIDQLNVKLRQVENANVRVKGKLRHIQEDLINLVETQEKSEKKQKEKLRWLQEQLKTKDDEIKKQSEYFEHYKQRQRQQTAVLRERECCLRSEVSSLEKQVLDLSARVALLTSELEGGMVQYLQQKLESAFSGTQGYNHSDVEIMELKTCIENVEHNMKSHLEALQQNLEFLREKEGNRREQADLLTELQCSQDTEDFLRRKLEESCRHVYSLKLSEIKLQEKMEELLDENRALRDQGMMKLKKKEKDSRLTRTKNTDSSVDLNGDLTQDDIQNLKWGAGLDSLRSRSTQTPVVLLHAEESEAPGCSYDGLKQIERLPEELLHNSSAFEKAAGLAEVEQAQRWYRELGFAETRYEEIKTRLTQTRSELDHLKKESGDKMLGKQHCKLMPVHTVKDVQEIEENKIVNKRLQQQILTLKAQLRDQAALENQCHDLQNEVELLQAQLCEKEKELQKRKSEIKLTLAPLKAKLACLTQKCQERNSFITRMHGEFHRRGIINPAFDEEVKNLVHDMALAEYAVAFTPVCVQEMLPSSTDKSQAHGQPEDHKTYVKVNEMAGSIPANSQQEVDSIHSSRFTPDVYAGSIKLTSPERIIALHRELRQNHRKNCQIPSVVSSNSSLKADFNLPMIHKETPLLSRMKNALVSPEHSAFWATKGRDQLSKCDDVFWGQIGNQHAGAIPQGMKQKNAIMNKAWFSREKTDGSTSATTAKSYLSDVLSASNKGRNPVGSNQLHGKE